MASASKKSSAALDGAASASGLHPERRLGGETAVLILDARSAVQFCSDAAAQLFDGKSDEILGRPISALIPALPLRTVTPGYNVAYARFWSVQHGWRRFCPSAQDAHTIPLEVSLKAAQRHHDIPYALVVSLRGAADEAPPSVADS